MSKNNALHIYTKFKGIESQVRYIREMYEETKDLSLNEQTIKNPGFYEAAQELLAFTKDFLDEIELGDDNLDLDKTLIGSVDAFFKGHPVTEYVDARIEQALGDNSEATKKRIEKAAEMIGEEQSERFVQGCSSLGHDPETCECEVSGEEGDVLDHMFDGHCYETFLDKIKSMGYTLDTVPVTGKFLAGIAANKDYCKICACPKEDEVGPAVTVNTSGLTIEGDGVKLEITPKRDYSLHEYVTHVSNMTTYEINTALDAIEQAYLDEKEFSEEDIEVLRFYLSNLPANSKHEIDELSDKAVVLAFKRRTMFLEK